MNKSSLYSSVESSSFMEKLIDDFPDVKEYDSRKLTKQEMSHALWCMRQKKSILKVVREALNFENLTDKASTDRSYTDLQCLPKKMYLECTILPALTDGLLYVAKERPVSPINALACFLLRNISTYEHAKEVTSSTRSKHSFGQSQSRASAKSKSTYKTQ